MKKVFSFCLMIILLLSLSISAFAEERVDVYGYRTDCYAGGYIDIPLYIDKNDGMMGFKLTINFSKDAFEVDYVVPTEQISKSGGTFSTNQHVDGAGYLDIIWTGTDDIKIEGKFIILRLNVKKTAPNGGYTIGINYSKDDTFNKDWGKVELHCSDVIVNVMDKEAFSTTLPHREPHNLTVEEMDEVIVNTLNEVGAESVNKLTDDNKADFVQNAENHIKQSGGEIKFDDKMTIDEKVDVILDSYPEEWDGKLPDANGKKLNVKIIAIASIFGIVIIALAFIFVVKTKSVKKKEIKQEEF